jgi:aminoglycoside 6'-N-acetyltransferase I
MPIRATGVVVMNLAIRTARREDFADWLRLREDVYTGIDRAFHQQEMALYLHDDGKQCLLAITDDGVACGMIEVSLRNIVDGCLTSPVGYIEGICVAPEYRGKGISQLLLQSAEDWCRSRGCQQIATDAELENEQAQRFHLHMGFEETYRIVEYRKTLMPVP